MTKWKKISHVVYQFIYYIVWCPQYRFCIIKGDEGKFIEGRLRVLYEWKNVEILELNVMEDHIHAVLTIPPKVSISELMGILK